MLMLRERLEETKFAPRDRMILADSDRHGRKMIKSRGIEIGINIASLSPRRLALATQGKRASSE